jgi:hypothetical protein
MSSPLRRADCLIDGGLIAQGLIAQGLIAKGLTAKGPTAIGPASERSADRLPLATKRRA